MRGDQPDVVRARFEGPGDQVVGLRSRLERLYLIGGEDDVEPVGQPSVRELVSRHVQRRVRQRGECQVRLAEAVERGRGVRMWRQMAHLVDDPLSNIGVESGAGRLGQHRERGALRAGEFDVATGEPTDEAQLQHLCEPLSSQRGAAGQPLE